MAITGVLCLANDDDGETSNRKGNGRSRFPSGMTTKKSNGKGNGRGPSLRSRSRRRNKQRSRL